MSPYPSIDTIPAPDLYPGYADLGVQRQKLIVRERPPLRLMIDVETPEGHHARWAADERKPANTPSGLGFSSTMPGGFEQLGVTLPRKSGFDYSDLAEFSTLTAYGVGGEVAWQGRLESSPRVSGEQMAITPGAVGYQALLSDDQTVTMVYVDRQLASFGDMPTARQIGCAEGNRIPNSQGVAFAQNNADQAVVQTISDTWASPWTPTNEAWYDAGPGSEVASVYYKLVTVNEAAADWSNIVGIGSSDNGIGFANTADLTAGTATGYHTPGSTGRYALLQQRYVATPAGTAGVTSLSCWENLAVYGDHGLTPRGSDPGGLYASDVIGHAVQTWAPELSTSWAGDSTITPTSFVIPHLVFAPEPTTAGEIVTQTARFGLEDWAVWDNKTFWFHPRGARGKSWRARVGPSGLQETGPQVERIANGVIVQYQDVTSTTRTAGPPNSGADTEDSNLLDTDSANPANAAGLQRWVILQMGTTTPAGAIQIGSIFLQEQKRLSTAGQAALVGYVEDNCGVTWPAWKVRAGDTIRFVDAADPSRDRRIVKAAYEDNTKTCTIDLDSPPDGLTAFIARQSVLLAPLGLS